MLAGSTSASKRIVSSLSAVITSTPPPARTMIRSLPAPVIMVSLPAPPSRTSSPAPPSSRSAPAPPRMVSLPASPLMMSSPPKPSTTSLPPPARIRSSPIRPLMVSSLPVPFRLFDAGSAPGLFSHVRSCERENESPLNLLQFGSIAIVTPNSIVLMTRLAIVPIAKSEPRVPATGKSTKENSSTRRLVVSRKMPYSPSSHRARLIISPDFMVIFRP